MGNKGKIRRKREREREREREIPKTRKNFV